MRDSWRRALLAMPSEAFLDLMRAYLGGLSTPYRKDELIDRLETLLKRGETADKALSLIDEGDAEALSAIIILEGPSRAELTDFLELGREEGSARIVNLEERLLVFEDPSPRGGESLRLVPSLAEGIRRVAWEPALLFPEADVPGKGGRGEEDGTPLDGVGLLALAAFFMAEDHAPSLKTDGKKRLGAKALREFSSVFPSSWDAGSCADILAAMGILRPAGDGMAVDREALDRAARDPSSMGALSAASDLGGEDGDAVARGIEAARALMPEGLSFSGVAMRRFLRLGLKRAGLRGRFGREALDAVVAGMRASGLVSRRDGGWTRALAPPEARGTGLSLGADFHVLAQAGIPLPSLARLVRFLEPVRVGSAAEFRLTRVGAARAFQEGMDSVSILGLLTSLSGTEAPQNVAYSLESWEREHRSVSISSGIVVSGDERLSRFMENSPAVRDSVVAVLAPGVYLTDFHDEAQAREALRKAGLDTPPRILGPRRHRKAPEGRTTEPPAPRHHAPRRDEPIESIDLSTKRSPPPMESASLLEAMREKVEAMEGSREVKDALKERIGLKLVIGEGALGSGSVKRDRGEAGGLDYLGKVKLAEKAIREPSWLLSVLYRATSGESERLVMRPVRLRKSPGGILLEGKREAPGEGNARQGDDDVSIPIERVSLLRRIRTSLFG